MTAPLEYRGSLACVQLIQIGELSPLGKFVLEIGSSGIVLEHLEQCSSRTSF